MENIEQKKKWIDELEDRFYAMARKYDFPEDIERDLYAFVFSVAQEHYRSGNRNGISWLRRQIGGSWKPAMTEPVAVPV